MNKQIEKHHDYRTHNWTVSLCDEEYEAANKRCAESGLCKSKFTRQALLYGRIVSRINNSDKEIVKGILSLQRAVNYIARTVLSINKSCDNQLAKAAPSVAEYLRSTEKTLTDLDENLAEISLYFSSRLGKDDS